MLGQVLEIYCNISSLNIKTSIDILSIDKCKVTFGFKYILQLPGEAIGPNGSYKWDKKIRPDDQRLASRDFIWLVMIKMPFLLLNNLNDINCGHVKKFVMRSIIFLDNIFIRFGSKLYRQIVGITMGTNCAPLVADLFLFCYERDFMLSLSDNNQADIIEAFNSTSRYLDDLLNIDNPYFEQMVGQIYPTELQLNKANSSDTEAPFLDLNLSITNGIVSSKIFDKQDDFNFEIVNFPFLDGDVPHSPSYGV